MSQFKDHLGTKLAIAAAITAVVVVGMITEKGWLVTAPLVTQRYSFEMSDLFVGLLVVGVLFSGALFAGFSAARSSHRTGDVRLHRGDSNGGIDSRDVCCPDEFANDVHAARTPWDNLLRIERMEGVQKEVPRRRSAKLADQFQAAVGTLIGFRSRALAEREPSAHAFTESAESARSFADVTANEFEASVLVRSFGRLPADPTLAREVTHAAGCVDDTLKSIPGIAERINPTALNAVIAAARAGETGKGFAVVARELMVLAAQTAKVLELLGVRIAEMQATTQNPSASRTSRPAPGPSERAHRRSQLGWTSRTRDAGERPRRRIPRPRGRRSGLT